MHLAATEGDGIGTGVLPHQRPGAESELATAGEKALVQGQGRRRVDLLDVPGVGRPVRGLREPREAGVVEAEGGSLRLPRQRHAAAVAAVALAVRAEPGRIRAALVRDLHGLGQAELLALVQVGRAGEREHQRGGRAGAGEADGGVGLVRGVRADALALRVVDREGEARGVPDDVVVGQHPGARGADRAERVQRLADHVAERLRVPRRHQVREVEGLVHLVRTHPEGGLLQRRHPGLAAQGAVAVVLGEHLVPVAVDLVHAVLAPVRHVRLAAAHGVGVGRRRVIRQALGLDHAVGHVDTEAVDAAVEPEAQDRAELLLHLLVVPVEVRLRRVEDVQIPLAGRAVGLRHALPHAAAEHRLPVVRRQLAVLAAAVAEDVARALRAARRRLERLLEPGVLVGGVVGHEVDDHPDAAGVGGCQHLVEVGQRAEQRVDVAVVGHVVAGVALRARHERAEPDRVDAELLQGVEAARDARQVADAVARRVREGAGVDLVDDGAAPPLGTGGCDLFELCHAIRLLQTLTVPPPQVSKRFGGLSPPIRRPTPFRPTHPLANGRKGPGGTEGGGSTGDEGMRVRASACRR